MRSFGSRNLAVLVWVVFAGQVVAQSRTSFAPGAPGKDAQWASAGKQGVGTSNTLESKVWFTLQGGSLTEVFYPTVDIPNVHFLEFVVVHPSSKTVETERETARRAQGRRRTTGSATPLAWSMAQFIRLAVNLKSKRNVDTPNIVAARYL